MRPLRLVAGMALVLALADFPVAAVSDALPTLSQEATEVLDQAKAVTLYSLEPTIRTERPGRSLDDFGVLGKTLLDPAEASRAIAAFRAAMKAGASPDRLVAACFDPRHAISIRAGGHRYDYLLCYACGSLEVFRDGKPISGVPARGSPDSLNSLLRSHGLPLSKSSEDD